MNYGIKETNQKIRDLKSFSRRFSSKVNITVFRVFLAVILLIVTAGCMSVFGIIMGLISMSPSLDEINVMPTGYRTTIYNSQGEEEQTLISAGTNRVYVTADQIPQKLKDAFVAIEDERFYTHQGIDVRSIMRAVFEVISSRKLASGGSTLTQQLLKNQVFGGGAETSNMDKIARKVQEQYLAVKFEEMYSKDYILELYLNSINLGNGAYGVQTASVSYFGKTVDELTLSEMAVLASIPKAPTNYNPVTNPENNRERRETVLKRMLEQGLCSQEEYDEALLDTEDLYHRIELKANEITVEQGVYSYYTDAVINQVIKDLVDIGYSQAEAVSLIYTGGLEIHTAQDPEIQMIVDQIIENEKWYPALGDGSYYQLSYALSVQKSDGSVVHYQLSHFLKEYNYFADEPTVEVELRSGEYMVLYYDTEVMDQYVAMFRARKALPGDTILAENYTYTIQPQISFCMIEQSTGRIVALVGGRGEKTANRVLNRATDSLRQVGSTFKVLASYLPAFDSLGLTLATPMDDVPYFYPGSTKEVQNWYKDSSTPFYGLSPLRMGIYHSMNILAVKTLEQVTPEVSFQYLKNLGFTSIIENKIGTDGKVYTDIALPLALGGLTDGVTNLEITAAYAAIANNGNYIKPYLYTKVYDHDGNLLLSNEPEPKQVMKQSTSFLLTQAMKDVISIGTGKKAQFSLLKNMGVAGKTGSTTDDYDLWFCGYTPYYTASIWSGFDGNYSQRNTKHYALWSNIMEAVHSNQKLQEKDFPMPAGIETASVCTKSGKLAVPGLCDKAEGGSTVVTEYFAMGTAPTETCDKHVLVRICKDSNQLATDKCNNVVYKVRLIKTEPEIYYPNELYPNTDPPILSESEKVYMAVDTEDIYDTLPDEIKGSIRGGYDKDGKWIGLGGTDEDGNPVPVGEYNELGEYVGPGEFDEDGYYISGGFYDEDKFLIRVTLEYPKNYIPQEDGTYKSPDGLFTLYPDGMILSPLGTFFINDDMKTMTSADGTIYKVDGRDIGTDHLVEVIDLTPTIGELLIRTQLFSWSLGSDVLSRIYTYLGANMNYYDVATYVMEDFDELHQLGFTVDRLAQLIEAGKQEPGEKYAYIYSTADTKYLVGDECEKHSTK